MFFISIYLERGSEERQNWGRACKKLEDAPEFLRQCVFEPITICGISATVKELQKDSEGYFVRLGSRTENVENARYALAALAAAGWTVDNLP